jgi:hypothetical protein
MFVKKSTIEFCEMFVYKSSFSLMLGFIPYFIGAGLTYSVIKEAVKIRNGGNY